MCRKCCVFLILSSNPVIGLPDAFLRWFPFVFLMLSPPLFPSVSMRVLPVSVRYTLLFYSLSLSLECCVLFMIPAALLFLSQSRLLKRLCGEAGCRSLLPWVLPRLSTICPPVNCQRCRAFKPPKWLFETVVLKCSRLKFCNAVVPMMVCYSFLYIRFQSTPRSLRCFEMLSSFCACLPSNL